MKLITYAYVCVCVRVVFYNQKYGVRVRVCARGEERVQHPANLRLYKSTGRR